ncbi:MAG TPA: hypothetical protein PKD55_17870 [Bellilinea sp.]|nr:hypothetical protein [Bellilinea sp.]
MNKPIIIIGIILGLLALCVVTIILLTPWMDRKGATTQEQTASLPGDDLIANPVRTANRAITVRATPQQIYPWIIQTGADKAGFYSYTWLENLVGCKMAKDEQIREEWQNLQVGDLMKMCDSEPAPPPYEVAMLVPDTAVVFGHRDQDEWVDLWSFVLIPQPDGSTRLIARTQTNMTGGFWEIIRPISFMMEQKMLATIKQLAERNAD